MDKLRHALRDLDDEYISYRELLSKIQYPADKVIVRNLNVTANAGVDSWGRQKSQPTVLSITLTLLEPFESAAETDTVDNSTVHYGTLSKKLMAVVSELSATWLPTYEFGALLAYAAIEVADPKKLDNCELEILYPKASMLGDGAGARYCFSVRGRTSTMFLKNVRIPCIIGVNSHERARKQLVVANVWVENVPRLTGELYFRVESILTQTIEKSSFDTLESLATTIVDELKSRCKADLQPQSTIRLQVEKPVAVPFADAPVIEIIRAV